LHPDRAAKRNSEERVWITNTIKIERGGRGEGGRGVVRETAESNHNGDVVDSKRGKGGGNEKGG